MKISIFARLIISHIIILFLVIAVNLYTIGRLGLVKQVTQSVLIFDNRMLELQNQLTDSLLSQMRYERKGLVMKDFSLYDQFLIAREEFGKSLSEAQLLADDYRISGLLTSLNTFWSRYNSLVAEEAAHLKGDEAYEQERYKEEKEQVANEALEKLKELEEYSRLSTYQKIKGLDAAVANAQSLALAIIAATLVLGVVISIIITRSITQPLAVIKKKTQEIAKGNFESGIAVSSPPEVGELARAFTVMCTRLREVDKMKADFLSLMAHELRTPLASIKEGTNLLLDGVAGDITHQQERILTIIDEEEKRLIRLVNSLLDLSKMEAGMMAYNFTEAELAPLIRKAVLELEPLAQAKSIRLEEKISAEVPPLRIDQEKLNQVLRNLLGNAIKFTPERGVITVCARPTDQGAEVSISDTGPGIPEEDLERIFDKYQQARTNNAHSTRGTGLGLAIVKHIITAHGGTVWAQSGVEQGSVFTFTLPRS